MVSNSGGPYKGRGYNPPVGPLSLPPAMKPVIPTTDNFMEAHRQSDVDSEPSAQHHTLGWGANNAAPGGESKRRFDTLDNLNYVGGLVQTYAPSTTGIIYGSSGGVLSGRFIDKGPVYYIDILIILGTGGSITISPTISIPFVSAGQHGAPNLEVQYTDAGTNTHKGTAFISGSNINLFYLLANVPSLQFGTVTNSAPFVWTVNDLIAISGWLRK